MKRINVIGTSGSGKSHFSRTLAELLNIKYIEMDTLHWKPNWEESSDGELFSLVQQVADEKLWVLDGNYSRTQCIKWVRVDTIIWLDYSFIRTFYQIVIRSIVRAWSQKELWKGTGNKESWCRSFCSRESVILWMLISYYRNKAKYQMAFTDEKYNHLIRVRLKTPAEAKAYIAHIQNS